MLGGISPHFQAWAFGWISNSETPGTVNRGLTQKLGGSAKCSEAPYVHGAHLHGMEGPRTLAPISGGSRGDPGVRANPPLDPC